jgi:hypothetical protein
MKYQITPATLILIGSVILLGIHTVIGILTPTGLIAGFIMIDQGE